MPAFPVVVDAGFVLSLGTVIQGRPPSPVSEVPRGRPDNPAATPLQTAWLEYVDDIAGLLIPELDDTPLFQYSQLRDNVVAIVKSESFLDGLEAAWKYRSRSARKVEDDSQANIEIPSADDFEKLKNVLILELRAFVFALKGAQTPTKPDEKKDWKQRFLGWGKTIVGSAKDLPEKGALPWYVEAGLTGFHEVLDIFKGD
jgi:hypothetical protein